MQVNELPATALEVPRMELDAMPTAVLKHGSMFVRFRFGLFQSTIAQMPQHYFGGIRRVCDGGYRVL